MLKKDGGYRLFLLTIAPLFATFTRVKKLTFNERIKHVHTCFELWVFIP